MCIEYFRRGLAVGVASGPGYCGEHKRAAQKAPLGVERQKPSVNITRQGASLNPVRNLFQTMDNYKTFKLKDVSMAIIQQKSCFSSLV